MIKMNIIFIPSFTPPTVHVVFWHYDRSCVVLVTDTLLSNSACANCKHFYISVIPFQLECILFLVFQSFYHAHGFEKGITFFHGECDNNGPTLNYNTWLNTRVKLKFEAAALYFEMFA